MSKQAWPPKEGLRFKCTGCGKCCTGSPGAVWIDEAEIEAMANYLKIDKKDFIQKYTRRLGSRLSLKEDPKNYDCVFLNNNQCSLYPVRPSQCKIYPWWPSMLSSKEAWDEEKERCEGLDHPEGDLYPSPHTEIF